MKKILAAILAASLALTLVACGAPAEQTGDEWQLRREKLTQEEVEQAPTEDQLVVLDTACGQIQGSEGWLPRVPGSPLRHGGAVGAG